MKRFMLVFLSVFILSCDYAGEETPESPKIGCLTAIFDTYYKCTDADGLKYRVDVFIANNSCVPFHLAGAVNGYGDVDAAKAAYISAVDDPDIKNFWFYGKEMGYSITDSGVLLEDVKHLYESNPRCQNFSYYNLGYDIELVPLLTTSPYVCGGDDSTVYLVSRETGSVLYVYNLAEADNQTTKDTVQLSDVDLVTYDKSDQFQVVRHKVDASSGMTLAGLESIYAGKGGCENTFFYYSLQLYLY